MNKPTVMLVGLLLVGSLSAIRTDEHSIKMDSAPSPNSIGSRLDFVQHQGDVLVIRRVWEGEEPDFWSANPSADGAFISEIDWSTGDLALIDLATGELRRVTDKGTRSWFRSGGWVETSVFSPDGRRMAYMHWNPERQGYEIKAIGVNGKNPRTILPNPGTDFYAMLEGWSPDGRHLLSLFWGDDGEMSVGLVSVDDGSIKTLAELGRWGAMTCVFSPDGKYVAYDRVSIEQRDKNGQVIEEQHDVFVVPVDGGSPTALLAGPANDRVLTWTPDGSGILLYSDRDQTEGIWFLPVSDNSVAGEPTLLRRDVWRLYPIGPSRDKYFYGVITQQPQVHIVGIDISVGQLTSAPKPVERFTSDFSHSAIWSADGRFLVYLRTGADGRRSTLIVRSVAGDDTRQIDVPIEQASNLRGWVKEGKSVYFEGSDADLGSRSFFRLDLESGRAERIIGRREFGLNAARKTTVVSPDEETAYFFRWGEGLRASELVARDMKTGTERVIYSGKFVPTMEPSPDGRTFAVAEFDRSTGESRVVTVPVTGGEPLELHRFALPIQLSGDGGFSWTPDSQYLLYSSFDEESSSYTLWTVDRTGGEPHQVGILPISFPPGIRELRMHPDQRRISFTTGARRGEIWVIENLPGGKHD